MKLWKSKDDKSERFKMSVLFQVNYDRGSVFGGRKSVDLSRLLTLTNFSKEQKQK